MPGRFADRDSVGRRAAAGPSTSRTPRMSVATSPTLTAARTVRQRLLPVRARPSSPPSPQVRACRSIASAWRSPSARRRVSLSPLTGRVAERFHRRTAMVAGLVGVGIGAVARRVEHEPARCSRSHSIILAQSKMMFDLGLSRLGERPGGVRTARPSDRSHRDVMGARAFWSGSRSWASSPRRRTGGSVTSSAPSRWSCSPHTSARTAARRPEGPDPRRRGARPRAR